MKNQGQKKLNDNVVLFPHLEKRLLEKGLEKIQQKRFREAAELLEEAVQLDPENSDAYIGLVLAYYEWGSLQKAKEHASVMLQKGIGEYIEIIDLYLMILVQLHQYDEIVTTIEVLLEEKEVPKEKFENFTRMLEFSRRMANEKVTNEMEETAQEDTILEMDLFTYTSQQEQINVAAQLAERNIRPYIDQMKNYLQSDNGQLFFKTMLLNVLSEHEYDKKIMIKKLGKEKAVVPIELPAVYEQPEIASILQLLSTRMEHENPILFDQIKELINRHFFILYPFQFESFNINVWAAAYHFLAAEYMGIDSEEKQLSELYQVEEADTIEAHQFLIQLEEISFTDF
ncbi:tetratricopeptide (TPR) repeat protein [Cytobacillus eiseniae]|uniref:Tetratricopeptide (TPR) repeat protein n=1 Tax=Cytobacillus eiseniae TaxID=762947 RepID=A0ABS4RCJ6_9BACI|nr:tetratricopeptide repeat protein [Cytobacillus eiseniae]MBP2240625.1 tetratricopeptide (TPR) repeat protein [Cytobacillus eiseniae]